LISWNPVSGQLRSHGQTGSNAKVRVADNSGVIARQRESSEGRSFRGTCLVPVVSRTITSEVLGRPAMEYRNSRPPARIYRTTSNLIWILLQATIALPLAAQTRVPLQPFAQQVRQVETSLAYLGQPLAQNDGDAINQAVGNANEAAAIERLEQILDKYTLAIVDINAESRVKVQPGPARPELVEAGSRIFLVKVINKAGVTARLVAESSSALPVFAQSDLSPEPPKKISAADTRDRWMDLELYDKDPMSPRLSGLPLEYRILQIYSRDPGQRSAAISFNVGQGTQDLGFRNEMVVVFTALPARPLRLLVRDENGAPSIAAFTIRDALGRLYPNPAKRLAPDLFFQPQVYRENGDTILVPAGSYTVISSMGPEYHAQTKQVEVTSTGSNEVSFAMQRWINPAKYRCHFELSRDAGRTWQSVGPVDKGAGFDAIQPTILA